MYLYNQTNSAVNPDHIVDGFRIGAKESDTLNVLISNSGVSTSYSARIIMPNTAYSGTEVSSRKVSTVGRSSAGINSITSNTLTFDSDHNLINGESIRVLVKMDNFQTDLLIILFTLQLPLVLMLTRLKLQKP